jgi:hypothetical protein
MDSKTLHSLRVGDTVTIHFTHMGSNPDDARGRPFDVVIAKFNSRGMAYQGDDGRYYEDFQISWRWADLPTELHPHELVRDDVRGFDTAHVSHIVAIVARAPYQSQPKPRNALFAAEQAAFLDHQKVEAYRKAKGERENTFGRRHTTATGHVFFEYSETYGRDIRPGQYNGHVFKWAQALIARRPTLAISGRLDGDRFYAIWNKAGRPGYVGPFKRMSSRLRGDDEPAEPSPYKALLNRKSFTRWVVRNAPRFVMTKAQDLKDMIKAAADEEEYMRTSMDEDFHRDYGQKFGDITFADPDGEDSEEDPQEEIAARQAERDILFDDEPNPDNPDGLSNNQLRDRQTAEWFEGRDH